MERNKIIGIVGSEGVVGKATGCAFRKLGHKVIGHDISLLTRLANLLECEAIYIAVPTPSHPDGSCNIDIVRGVLEELDTLNYAGLCVIKSTVKPGTTIGMQLKYPNLRIAHNGEHLRERYSVYDSENIEVLIVGTENTDDFEIVKSHFGRLARTAVRISPTESELSKYFLNDFHALLITFANSFYTITEALGCSYDNIKTAISHRADIPKCYLDANSSTAGFGGKCLPKDMRATVALCKELDVNVEFFQHILDENSKYRSTVLPGMRAEND